MHCRRDRFKKFFKGGFVKIQPLVPLEGGVYATALSPTVPHFFNLSPFLTGAAAAVCLLHQIFNLLHL